jgi:hypothetical protein
MEQKHLDKFDLIDRLEGREVPTPSGRWCPVRAGRKVTPFGTFSLAVSYDEAQLEAMYRASRPIGETA